MRRLETQLDGPVLLELEVPAAYCAPELESGFRFDDPEVGIEWPAVELVTSERDWRRRFGRAARATRALRAPADRAL